MEKSKIKEVEIRTNGGIEEDIRYYNPSFVYSILRFMICGIIEEINVLKISNRKNKSSGFSPDISFKWKNTVTDIQIKTQFRPQEVKDDIIIVQYWNTKGKINNYNYRAYFILMIIAPPEKEKDFWKRVESNIEKLNKELNVELKPLVLDVRKKGFPELNKELNVEFKPSKKESEEDWLRIYIASPI